MEKELKKYLIRLDTARINFSNQPEYLPTFSWEPLASAMKNQDLMYGESTVIVTQRDNLNGAFFTNEFIVKNYKSFLLKPVNINHEDTKIIGVIYDAKLFDQNGCALYDYELQYVENEDGTKSDKLVRQDPFHVVLKFVIFKWIYQEVATDIVAKQISALPYGISMEIYSFQSSLAENSTYGFMYNHDISTFEPYSSANTYLDDKCGLEYEGKKVSRVFKNGSFFGGIGIVDIPAEPLARIRDLSSHFKGVNIDINTPLIQLAKKDLARSKQVPHFDGTNINIKFVSNKDNEKDDRGISMTKEEIQALVDEQIKKEKASLETEAKLMTDNKKAADESAAKTIILTERFEAKVKEVTVLTADLDKAKTDLTESKTLQEQLKETASKSKEDLEKVSKELEEVKKEVAEFKKIQTETKAKELANSRLGQLEEIGVVYKDEAAKIAKLQVFANMTEEGWNEFFAAVKEVTPNKPKKDTAGLVTANEFGRTNGLEGQEQLLEENKTGSYVKNMAGLSNLSRKKPASSEEGK